MKPFPLKSNSFGYDTALLDWNALAQFYPDNLPYHNLEHIQSFDFSTAPNSMAIVAGLFHDAHYDPKGKKNEEKAFEAYLKCGLIEYNSRSLAKHEEVQRLIMSTKDHPKYYDDNDPSIYWLHWNDLAYLRETDMEKIRATEMKIFKEYQFTPWLEYKERRTKILQYYATHPLVSEDTVGKIVAFLSIWQPRIGIFPGSFDPLHVGHLDVLLQAEQVFDKVIIAQGQNLEKPKNDFNLFNLKTVRYHEKERYEGSLFTFLNKKQAEYPHISVVRGLRNNDDLEHESIIHGYKSDYTSVPSVFFMASPKYRHLSSGAVKQLQKVGLDASAYLVS